MALDSNIHRKPRRLKGTKFFVFRYYIWGSVTAFSSLCFLAFYFSPLNKGLYDKYLASIDNEEVQNSNFFTFTGGIPKTSETLIKEKLELEKQKDTTLY